MSTTFDIMAHDGNPRNSEGAFVQLKNGSILFIYSRYEGTSFHDNAAASLAGFISDDDGKTWKNTGVIISRSDADNIMSVSLLRLQNGRILLTFLEKRNTADPVHVECVPLRCFSDDEGKTWSKPERVTPRHQFFVVNNDRVIQLKSGRLLMPRALHIIEENGHWKPALAGLFYSDDQGRTWSETEQQLIPPDTVPSGFQEPGVIELKDGRVMMWMRNDSGYQYKSFSRDGGLIWSEAVPAPEFSSPCSPLSMKRRQDGVLVAVWNNSPSKTEWFRRTPLVMAESADEGTTWSPAVPIGTDPDRGYCYTAMLFLKDALLLGYCFGTNKDGHCCLQDIRIERIG